MQSFPLLHSTPSALRNSGGGAEAVTVFTISATGRFTRKDQNVIHVHVCDDSVDLFFLQTCERENAVQTRNKSTLTVELHIAVQIPR